MYVILKLINVVYSNGHFFPVNLPVIGLFQAQLINLEGGGKAFSSSPTEPFTFGRFLSNT